MEPMKTKYVKVPVSDRCPKDRNDVIVIDEYGQSGEAFFMKNEEWHVYNRDVVTGRIDFWLEEKEDHSEEMLSLLEELISLKHLKDTDGKTPYYLERQPKAWEKAKQLINKVKDNG
ncbi:hypothetical protein BAY06_03985 [Elizabethkingia anophelis]|uniref:hypothetical protein n=1 Tax=Elizabethkingia anophelis TaxID=1117645 RepID=UPI00099B19F3|nr:hypothetical protein [Elizabethkingia anophelis]OPC51497.1 hypothetical protein BAY06_03985 [Elizabethkingia anophelis]